MVADLMLDGDGRHGRSPVAEAQTPPFLTDTRVVVARGAERLDADGVAALQAYLAAPLPTTDLVLIYAGKPTKKLLDAVKGAGGVVAAPDVGSNRRDRSSFVDEQVAASGLRLTTAATAAWSTSWARTSTACPASSTRWWRRSAPGARLDVDDVTPYLGEGGGIPPWDLTDAIDRGDRAAALGALSRMVHAGGRHPLVVMAILHTHYGRLLRLEGSGAHDEASAGAVLGLKGFAARKAVERARAMGPDAIHSAIQLMAQADMDLRGQRELPEEAVLEVLVARLCRLTRHGGQPPAAGADRQRRVCGAERVRPGPGRPARPREAQASVAAAFIRRLLRRAAWFLWMTPLAAALSRRFWASCRRRLAALSSRRSAHGGLDPGLELGADRLVALGALGVGDVPLLLALDVGHQRGSFAISRARKG